MSTWRRLLTMAALVALGASLAACSGNSRGGSAASTTGSGATSTIALSRATIRKDVHMFNCGAEKSGWSAGGTVKSSLNHSATYDITVFFTTSQSENLDYGETSVPLKAGQVKLWSVSAIFAAPRTVLCVLTSVTTS